MKNIFNTYKWISFMVAIGIPQLVYTIVKENSELSGAMAITHTLKYLGFNIHMELGIKSLIILGVLSFILSEWFIIVYYKYRVEKDIIQQKLDSVSKVLLLIENYSIPTPLKQKLKTYYL